MTATLGRLKRLSAGKLKPSVSANKLKKVKHSSRRLEAASDTPAYLPREEDYAATEAVVAVAPAPRSASMAWPVLAVVVALGVGLLVWKAMQGPPESSRPHVVEPVVIPGAELPGTDTVQADVPPKNELPVKADPPVVRAPKEKGEVTLVLIPEATVMKG